VKSTMNNLEKKLDKLPSARPPYFSVLVLHEDYVMRVRANQIVNEHRAILPFLKSAK